MTTRSPREVPGAASLPSRFSRVVSLGLWLAIGLLFCIPLTSVEADELADNVHRVVARKPISEAGEDAAVPPPNHPLAKPYEIVLSRLEYIRDNIRDYTCVLVKRERIGEELQDHQYIFAKVRIEQLREGRVVRPFSVYLHYLAPDRLEGRKVLFVEGQNEGKMLVRNGGNRFSFVTVKVSPDSDLAKKESLMPITDMGFEKMAVELAKKIELDVRADPKGENTKVEYFSKARIDGRDCSRIQVTHPLRQDNLEFHKANVFLDEKWNLPLRIEIYSWPAEPGGEPLLMGEYTYSQLKVNVGLPDAAFEEGAIRGR